MTKTKKLRQLLIYLRINPKTLYDKHILVDSWTIIASKWNRKCWFNCLYIVSLVISIPSIWCNVQYVGVLNVYNIWEISKIILLEIVVILSKAKRNVPNRAYSILILTWNKTIIIGYHLRIIITKLINKPIIIMIWKLFLGNYD
jgi:hypothetical protein